MRKTAQPDYGHDRARWAGLIRDAHEAAASPVRDRVETLAQTAAAARNTWLAAAPYPDGLAFPLFAGAALAWARRVMASPESERGSRLLGVMLETASLADEILAVAPSGRPAVRAPTMEELAAGQKARLPYRDDA